MAVELKPVISVDQFGGLDLDNPLALVGAGAAVDLLDVDWDAQGVLGSRMGTEKLTSPAHNYESIFGAAVEFAPRGEVFALLGRRGKTLVRIDEAGEEKATIEVSEGDLSFVQVGLGVLRPVTYIAGLEMTIKKFVDTEFSSPTATVDGVEGKAMPEAGQLTTWPDQGNRLVVVGTGLEGGPGGAGSSPTHIWFSEPGKPESFESTAYVQLNPGDGEQIVTCCNWNREVFIFKERHLHIFYGVDVDEEGKPIFNYRTVDLGTRVRGACVAGREGVYFLAEDGIWVTTGGTPVLVSATTNLSLFRRDSRTTLGGLAFPSWNAAKRIAFLDDCLYVGFLAEEGASATTTRLLKIDLETGRTTYWSTDLLDFVVWSSTWSGVPRLFFSGAGESTGVYFFTPDTDEDVVVEMDPYWVSGHYDLGDPDEKTLTVTKVWGSGTVDIAVGEDYGDTGASRSFALGAGAAIDQAELQRGQTGTLLYHKISGTAPWSIQRITRYLRESRVPATEKP